MGSKPPISVASRSSSSLQFPDERGMWLHLIIEIGDLVTLLRFLQIFLAEVKIFVRSESLKMSGIHVALVDLHEKRENVFSPKPNVKPSGFQNMNSYFP